MDKQKDRKYTSALIKSVLLGKISTLDALKKFPKTEDKSIKSAFMALVHLEADEDIRKKDLNFKDEQDDYLLYLSQILEKGEDIPVNIIKEYEKYDEEALIYPDMNFQNVIKRLKKFINL